MGRNTVSVTLVNSAYWILLLLFYNYSVTRQILDSTTVIVNIRVVMDKTRTFPLKEEDLVQNSWRNCVVFFSFQINLYANTRQCTCSEFCCWCWNHSCVVSLVLKKNKSESCVPLDLKMPDKREMPAPNRQVQQQTELIGLKLGKFSHRFWWIVNQFKREPDKLWRLSKSLREMEGRENYSPRRRFLELYFLR